MPGVDSKLAIDDNGDISDGNRLASMRSSTFSGRPMTFRPASGNDRLIDAARLADSEPRRADFPIVLLVRALADHGLVSWRQMLMAGATLDFKPSWHIATNFIISSILVAQYSSISKILHVTTSSNGINIPASVTKINGDGISPMTAR